MRNKKGFTPTPKFFGVSSRSERGFTLIEILIAVAVVGILASVVLVGIGPVTRQGRDARRASDLQNTRTALELFYNKNGQYPIIDSTIQWDAAIGIQKTLEGAGIGVTKIPDDPTTTRHYKYVSNGVSYVLGAQLDDLNNPLYAGDVDGTVLTLDCGPATGQDTMYCVQL